MANNNYTPKSEEVLEIGRIPRFRSEIDPDERISKYIKSKMSIIDLIPCMFNVPYSNIFNLLTDTKSVLPKIEYKKAINDYRSICDNYGLYPYSFLRLYLTDMTSSTDEMSNEYMKNVIDETLNSTTMQRIMAPFKTAYSTSESLGSKSFNKIIDLVKNMTSENIQAAPDMLKQIDTAAVLLTHGTRINFPKVWASASYSPNLNCVIKLVSPYGHPKAIREFIIKPLAYLLILLSPSTRQGLVTERPNYLTLKSYGLSNLMVCYPRSISIRRGGDSTSFNKYKQPTVVEVSLTFEATTEGFAFFKSIDDNPEKEIFTNSNDITTKPFKDDFEQPFSLFPTLKSFINSFRPFDYDNQKDTSSGDSQTGSGSTTSSNPVGYSTSSNNTSNTNPVPTKVSTVQSTSDSSSYEASPSAIYLSSDNTITFSTPNTSSKFQAQIATSTKSTKTIEYDPTNFQSDSNFSNISTNQDNSTHILTFGDSLTTNEDVAIRFRNLPSEDSPTQAPGFWSGAFMKEGSPNPEPSSTEIQVLPSIFPEESIFNQDARWDIVNNNTNVTVNNIPRICGSINLEKNNDYSFVVRDLSNNILKQSSFTPTNTTYPESTLNIIQGNLKIVFNVPSVVDINLLTFLLISDSHESPPKQFKPNQIIKNLNTSKYYLSVKYNNQTIEYSPGVSNYIIIGDTSVKTVFVSIGNDLKINSIVEG